MFEVNGNRGYFNPRYTEIGSYGRNAAIAAIQLGQYDGNLLAQSDVRYTNANCPNRTDALGFAAEDIAAHDPNQDGALSQREFFQMFGGANEVSNRMFQVIDVNQDGYIDILEDASYVMLQDKADGRGDGLTTAEGRYRTDALIVQDPYAARDELLAIRDFIGPRTVGNFLQASADEGLLPDGRRGGGISQEQQAAMLKQVLLMMQEVLRYF